MALGLIGAALTGGAQAANEIADNSIQKKRERALLELKDRYAARDAERRHGYNMDELSQRNDYALDQMGMEQDFTAGQNQLTRQQERELALLRERGANSRAAASRNDWQMMTSSDGQPIRVNSRTGQIEPMSVPEGISFPKGDSWGDRDQAYMDSLQAELSALQEIGKSGMPLSDEQQARLQQIPQEMRTYAQGIDADSEVLSTYGGMRGGGNEQAGGPPGSIAKPSSQQSGSATSGREYLETRRQQEQASQQDKQALQRVEALTEQAKDLASRIEPSTGGRFQVPGLLRRSEDQTDQLRQQAQQTLVEVVQAFDAEKDPARKAQLQEAMDALYKRGITLPK